MCMKYESCRTYTFYMAPLQRLLIFHNCVYKSMGSSPIGSPVDSSHILSHISHNTYPIDLKILVFEKKQNYQQNDTKFSTVGNKLL